MDRREKLRQTNIAKYGSEEAYREEMRRRGMRANRFTPRGFAKLDTETVKELSRRGVDARKEKDIKRAEEYTTGEEDGKATR